MDHLPPPPAGGDAGQHYAFDIDFHADTKASTFDLKAIKIPYMS